MSSEEFLCVRCSRHMKTCCQTAEIFATAGDVTRIELYSGERNFNEFRTAKNPSYADQDDDPVWRDNVFREDGSRRVIKRQANGDCHFLGEQGCRLPLETRPLICRLYPFDYNAEGILDELSSGCPIDLLPPGQGLIEALDMKIDDARRWRKQLYEEIQRERQQEREQPQLA